MLPSKFTYRFYDENIDATNYHVELKSEGLYSRSYIGHYGNLIEDTISEELLIWAYEEGQLVIVIEVGQ